MIPQLSHQARTFALFLSLLAIGSLIAQVGANMADGEEFSSTLGWMFQFFTIWGNFAAGVIFAWIAWRGTIEPRVPFALSAALVIIAVVYHVLLADAHHPEGVDWWTNIAHHTLVPLGGVLWWLAHSREQLVSWKSLPVVVLVPLAYGAFALANGAVTGFYPYFFLDLPSLGWPMLLVNMVGLALLFMAVAAVLLAIRSFVTARA
ncbi:Pr6Pr family membrane protein [Qipengyuania sphaerica]|uniref:Pr6Pr family membrane protein n=1 Tax=Qipengyuania sphaerica TaxID=2867243 RepID=UPI001C8B0241|nr:Pr6Pr family membrane protein [Qipengyuania sphaerica]MBX7542098.1 Pr6Pr family membrane protein [Qipengyuania sphaerica]